MNLKAYHENAIQELRDAMRKKSYCLKFDTFTQGFSTATTPCHVSALTSRFKLAKQPMNVQA